MSAPAFAWALERGRALKLSPTKRILLVVIADYANCDGDCWAGQETLSDATGLDARSVRTLGQALEALGLIRIGKRGRGLEYHIVRPNGAYEGPTGNRTQLPVSAATPEPASATIPETPSDIAPLPETPSGVKPDTASGVDPRNRKELPLTIPISEAAAPKPEAASAEPKKDPSKEERKEEHPPIPPRAEGGRVFDPPGFDAFWQLYPRKVGRLVAAKAFAAAVNRGNKPADILTALAAYPFNANPQYQPHPTTWLREGRWLDEVDSFDPVLRAAGLRPEDFLDAPPGGLLQ